MIAVCGWETNADFGPFVIFVFLCLRVLMSGPHGRDPGAGSAPR